MRISRASVANFPLFLGTVLFALLLATPSGHAAPAPPDAGQEPTGAPIFYNLTPPEGTSVAQDKLSRAAATIETRRETGVSWAGIYIDGQIRPSELMGPVPYLQTVSVDIGDLGTGAHTVRVVAVDSEGRAGSWAWSFTII